MSDIALLRLGIVVAGVLLMAAIYFFGRPRKPGQGRKLRDESTSRAEPRLDARPTDPDFGFGVGREGAAQSDDGAGDPARSEFDDGAEAPPPSGPEVGKRDREEFDKIVTLYVAARAGHEQGRHLALSDPGRKLDEHLGGIIERAQRLPRHTVAFDPVAEVECGEVKVVRHRGSR